MMSEAGNRLLEAAREMRRLVSVCSGRGTGATSNRSGEQRQTHPPTLTPDEVFGKYFEGVDHYLTMYSHLIRWLDKPQGPILTSGAGFYHRVEGPSDSAGKYSVYVMTPCRGMGFTLKKLAGVFDTEKEAKEFAERETAVYWFWTDYIS